MLNRDEKYNTIHNNIVIQNIKYFTRQENTVQDPYNAIQMQYDLILLHQCNNAALYYNT